MVLLKRKSVLAAKIETTPGTAETLANADGAFNIYNPEIQGEIEVEEREGQGGFNYLPGVPGLRSGTVTFRSDVWWDGTSTHPLWATTLLPACGWVNSSGTYNPTTEAPGSNVKTVTIALNVDGRKKTLAGAVGAFQLVCPTGKMAYFDWTFTGVWQGAADEALLTPTYPTDSPIRYSSATSTFNSNSMSNVSQVTFDSGNEITLREDASTAAGFTYGVITNRKPVITADPESKLVATRDDYGDWLSATEGEFSVLLDGTSTSTIEIQALKAQIMNAQAGERNNLQTESLTFNCNKNGANTDQELQFIFTPTV